MNWDWQICNSVGALLVYKNHSQFTFAIAFVFTILFSCLFAVRQFGMRVLHMFRQTERYDHIHCVFYYCVWVCACLCLCVCVWECAHTRSYVWITFVLGASDDCCILFGANVKKHWKTQISPTLGQFLCERVCYCLCLVLISATGKSGGRECWYKSEAVRV